MIIQGQKLIQLKKAYIAYLERLIQTQISILKEDKTDDIIDKEIKDVEEFLKNIDFVIKNEF